MARLVLILTVAFALWRDWVWLDNSPSPAGGATQPQMGGQDMSSSQRVALRVSLSWLKSEPKLQSRATEVDRACHDRSSGPP
jgi:hypothetical protein